jgi:hypothetical protein
VPGLGTSISETDRIGGLVAPISLATCRYVATTHHEVDPRPLFDTLETPCELVTMNRAALRRALGTGVGVDFEDLYLAEAGKEAGAEAILTRNEQDFTEGPLPPSRIVPTSSCRCF